MNPLKAVKSLSPNARGGILASIGGLLATADPQLPILGSARNLVLNELLGVDDFRRALRYADEGEFGKMLKSLGAGTFELGSTVIPGGQILKAGKVGKAGQAAKTLLEAAPIGGRIVSSIPGATRLVGGVPELTRAGRTGLQAFRVGEAGQLLDFGNAGLSAVGLPSAPIGTARTVANEARERVRRQALQNYLRQMYNEMYGGMY